MTGTTSEAKLRLLISECRPLLAREHNLRRKTTKMNRLTLIMVERSNGVWIKKPAPSWPANAHDAFSTLADAIGKCDYDGSFVEGACPDDILDEFRQELEERGGKAAVAVRAIVVDAEAPRPVVSMTVTEACGAYGEYGGAWSVLDVSSLFTTACVKKILAKFAEEFADHERLADGGNRYFGLQPTGDVACEKLSDSLRAAGTLVVEDWIDAEDDDPEEEA